MLGVIDDGRFSFKYLLINHNNLIKIIREMHYKIWE